MRSKLAKSSSSRSNGFFANSGKQSSNGIQTKLQVNKPGDQYEVEADKTADHVVGQSMGSILSSKSSAPGADFGKPLPVTLRPSVSSSAQRKEEDVQVKEGENQSDSEDVQLKESEIAPMGMSDKDLGEEDPIRAQAIQMKEDESVQLQEEDEESEDTPLNSPEIQAKEEEVQAKEDEDVQLQEDEEVQLQDDEVQAKEDEEVQAKEFVGSSQSTNGVSIDQKLSDSKGGGSPLPKGVKAEMESGFGVDFSAVRIHTDSRAESMNEEVGAKAFTHKNDIYFNQGNFDTETKEGKLLLAHELTHTIQQGAISNSNTTSDSAREATASSQPEGKSKSTKTPVGNAQVPVPEAIGVENAEPLEQEQDVEVEDVQEETEPATIRNPHEDPGFVAVTGSIAEEAAEQEAHAPASELSEEAQEAAESPSNERESLAEAAQVEEMEESEPGEFNAAEFKAKLMDRIASMQLPANEEEADDFENNNNIDEVNQDAMGDVNSERQEAAGAIEQTSQAEPNVAGVPEREVTPLPEPDYGPKPQDVNAGRAVPAPRGKSEVNTPLQENSAELDQRMAESNVTDHQLAISEEPSFEEALDSKKTAQADAVTAPEEFRKEEGGIRGKSAQKAENESAKELEGMHMLRGTAMDKVLGDQKATGEKDTSERERIAGEINTIYENTKTDVEKILNDLESDVTKYFTYASLLAKAAFEDYVARKMAEYKQERYGGVFGGFVAIGDFFVGLPDEVNQFFVDGRKVFISTMDGHITKIAEHVANELNRAKDRIQSGLQEVVDYVESLPANLQSIGKEAAEEIQDKFSALVDDVNSKQDELVDSLAQQYMESLNEVDERIEEMKAANRGLIDAALDFINGVIETIRKLKEMIENLLSAIMSVVHVIMEDPIGFMKNLFEGIGQGIDAFKANIQTHMMGGLIEWLTGSLGPMGITLPDDIFSLKGIFSLVLQVLGLGWDFIRQKAVMMMGEPMVNALTKGYDMFTTFATQGVMGIWEYLKDQFTDLKETVIDAIKGMLITQVIEAGIKWLLSLLIPGAGFIKAIMAIKDIIVFFVESAVMLIPAITEAILALAAGSVVGVAKAIEFGLSKLIALVINLFAKLIGLGGLSKRVMAIFKKIRKRVDRAVMKLLNKAKKAGRKLMAKLGFGKKPTNPKEHDAQVKAGLTYLKQQSKAEDKDGNKTLTAEEAQKAASKTKKKFAVFTSITPRVVGGKWVYDWTGSKDTLPTDFKAEESDLPPYKLPAFSSNKATGFDAIITKDVPMGQESSAQKGAWPAWDAVRGGKADGTYVRTHLLYHRLGGKATISNLTPTKTGLNTRFNTNLEQKAFDDVKKNQTKKAIWYRVNINYYSEEGFTDYISKISASYGEYLKKDGSWQYGKTLHKFAEDSPKPIFGDRVYNLNTDGAQALSGADGIDFNFADLIIRERKENGNFKDAIDFRKRMGQRKLAKRVIINNFTSQMTTTNLLIMKNKIIL